MPKMTACRGTLSSMANHIQLYLLPMISAAPMGTARKSSSSHTPAFNEILKGDKAGRYVLTMFGLTSGPVGIHTPGIFCAMI